MPPAAPTDPTGQTMAPAGIDPDRDIVAVILAGGQSRRMGGGDKSLIQIAGHSVLAHLLNRLRPQVGRIVINANGDPTRFAAFGLPVVADCVTGHDGPLAGILTGLAWAEEHGVPWVLCVAADTPLLPCDLAHRLSEAVAIGAPMAIAGSGERLHPTIGLWPTSARSQLYRSIHDEDLRKIRLFTGRLGAVPVFWPIDEYDPFFNINTPEDAEHFYRIRESLKG